jgi:uncharacterized membrane protein YdbT with pleckstrin-like domain
MNERTVWKGKPSQALNLRTFFLCALISLVAIFFFIGLKNWIYRPTGGIGFKQFVLWDLSIWILAPMVIAVWKWLAVRSQLYEVTTERIRVTRGVLTRRSDDLELYRVKDIILVQPFIRRLFGLGDIVLTTNDSSSPVLVLPAVPRAKWLREEIRRCVEVGRVDKGVHVAEVE